MRKGWLFLIVLLAVPTAAAARSCEAPASSITRSAQFCGLNYNPRHGVSIDADDIIIDCGNGVLQGEVTRGLFQGTGISIIGRRNVTVKNCKVALYDTGVLVKDSTEITIVDSSFIRNRVGLKLVNTVFGFFERNHDISIELPIQGVNASKNVVTYTNKRLSGDFCRKNVCNDSAGIAVLADEENEQNVTKRALLRTLRDGIRSFLGTG